MPSIGDFYRLKEVEEEEEVSRIVVRIEIYIFDCPICYDALYPPIYQILLPSIGAF